MDAGTTTIVLADALSTLTTVVSGVVSIIAAQPILSAMFCVPLVGAGIGLIKRIA